MRFLACVRGDSLRFELQGVVCVYMSPLHTLFSILVRNVSVSAYAVVPCVLHSEPFICVSQQVQRPVYILPWLQFKTRMCRIELYKSQIF